MRDLKEKIDLSGGSIRNQISMQKVYEAFHLALRQGKTCQLCNGRPCGQLCCTESDSMCTSRILKINNNKTGYTR